ATLYDFGMISSVMHMAWVRQTCGRLESRYRYSKDIVYNNYPWPEAPNAKQRAAVKAAAQNVLNARKAFPNATLADLYDPLAMPPALVKAHAELDRAVDLCYRAQPFQNDRQRVEYLFALYEKLTAPLITTAKKRRRKS
ncbi:MAG: type IIL restriction-modification enzyme MmeI, partial [Terriglobales bacterium]